MNRSRWILRRIAFSVIALWAILTVTFLFVALSGDPGEAVVRYGVAQDMIGGTASSEEIEAEAERAVQAYRDARNLDDPIHHRYLNWMYSLATFDLGTSYTHPTPVTTLLTDRLTITMAYVLPGMTLGIAGGTFVGTYAVVGRRRLVSRIATLGSYTAFGIPNFWIAIVAIGVGLHTFHVAFMTGYDTSQGVTSMDNLYRLVLPSILIATAVMAEQARFVRSELKEHEHAAFVKQVRSTGVSEWRVSRHILRVSLLPLLSLVFAKLLGVFVLNVFVIEFVFGIPGFGQLSYNAILNRNLPVIVGMTLVIAVIGVVGNLIQDVLWVAFDPRATSKDA